MADRLHISTRKGLFTVERRTSGWALADPHFLGDTTNMLLRDARDDTLYVAMALGHFGVKMHRSEDQGKTWTECSVPTYPEGAEIGRHPFADADDPTNQPKPASLSEIWALEPGGADQPGLLWAGTIPGGLFRSSDRGDNWELVQSLWDRPERSHWFGGGKDDPGIHSICVDPRDSAHLTVGVSCGGVWVTRDGGDSWSCQATGMRAEFMPPDRASDPNIQDPHRVVCCPAAPDVFWAQHHNGIFLSRNDCESWSEIKDVQPSGFGFAVAVHPHDPDVAWFVPAVKDECRIPVDGRLVVTRTRDGGQTFQSLTQGLPQSQAYDLVFRHCLEVDETGECLAMGSSTGSLWISEDGGASWQHISAHLPQIYCVRFT